MRDEDTTARHAWRHYRQPEVTTRTGASLRRRLGEDRELVLTRSARTPAGATATVTTSGHEEETRARRAANSRRFAARR